MKLAPPVTATRRPPHVSRSNTPASEEGELTLTQIHPGVEPEQVQEATAWELRIAEELDVTEPPSDTELVALRSLRTKGAPA